MRVFCEVTWEDEEKDEPNTEKGLYILLHWGLQYEIIQVEEGRLLPVNYTVGICQDYETGEVRCFLPGQIKILGQEIKK